MATLADFRIAFPEFASTPDEQVQFYLDLAAQQMDTGVWGDLFDQGQLFLAAHLLSVSLTAQAGGGMATGTNPIKSRSVGDVSVAFSVSDSDNGFKNFYNSTIYGQQYQLLVRIVGAGAIVSAGSTAEALALAGLAGGLPGTPA